jgi:hypothetical protein
MQSAFISALSLFCAQMGDEELGKFCDAAVRSVFDAGAYVCARWAAPCVAARVPAFQNLMS